MLALDCLVVIEPVTAANDFFVGATEAASTTALVNMDQQLLVAPPFRTGGLSDEKIEYVSTYCRPAHALSCPHSIIMRTRSMENNGLMQSKPVATGGNLWQV